MCDRRINNLPIFLARVAEVGLELSKKLLVADYQNAESKNQQKWLITLKLLATLAICVVLVWQADWTNVLSTLKNMHASLLVFVFVLMVMSVTLSTYKWKLMLSIHNIQYNFSTLHKYYFIAQFLNNFLPTSIGGDAYRVYKTWDNPRSNSCAVIAVFMERLTGMAALALLAYISSIIVFLEKRDVLSRTIVTLGSYGLVATILAIFLLLKTNAVGLIIKSGKSPKILTIISEHLKDYFYHPTLIIRAIFTSFWFHLHNCLPLFLLLVLGVNASCSILELFVAYAIMNVIAILPISINGIGVTEASFIYSIGLYGVPYNDAFVIILLIRVLLIPISLIGAILYFMTRRHQQEN
jgi:uncharacterized protein (TIRG00374 family)